MDSVDDRFNLSPDSMQRSGPKPQRQIELDFIRGIAILLVVDYHEGSLLLAPFRRLYPQNFEGAVGVAIFFVLSGFLVGGLLMREWKERHSLDWKRFLIRRGLKIWPQYYVFILIILLTGHRPLVQMWGNILNIQNYIGGVAHTWSLAVEEHAYLFLTAVIAVGVARQVSKRHMFLGLAALAAGLSVFRDVQSSRGVPVFLPSQYRMTGILFGVLIAMLFHFWPHHFARLQSSRAVWVTVIAGWLVYQAALVRYPRLGAVLYDSLDLLGVATLLLLYRSSPTLGRKNPVYRSVAWIGLYSYGIYLWHVSVGDPISRLLARLPHTLSPLVVDLIKMAIGIALGIVMSELVEIPMLRLRDRIFPKQTRSRLEVGIEEVAR
ncbi:acyltransferase family protein [Terriglobus roseus]|uniref:Peptidoglycan/LPS O-acetylase OafA/YrhL, contains acyltransferase and SGNH-hydrolase domains n=1 Tax=Terriglobus roseus TaxID=392734 RepID=A0A1H4PBN3_9BACT|nr:acyltransferase [Terriglobus roseus]SEC04755.1 Peptidoglycan/LPS O-acetylase OafA/YrhL, contains acyltransferase and SGNH-hydrolase domains [Terriglobus roseus]